MSKTKIKTKAGYMHSIVLGEDEERSLQFLRHNMKVGIKEIFMKGVEEVTRGCYTSKPEGAADGQVRTISHEDLERSEV